MNLQEYKTILSEKRGQQKQLLKDLSGTKEDIKQYEQDVEYTEQARAIIQLVAQETQQQLEFHISELVTLALAGVFERPYEFKVEFTQRRNRTECDMYFIRNGERVNPTIASGGGPLNIASFALQTSIWSLKKTRPVLFLDEPFRFLSRGLQDKAVEILKQISSKLNLQILMITHSPDMAEGADRTFNVSISGGVSKVEQEGIVRRRRN